jgi:hypothetical protein
MIQRVAMIYYNARLGGERVVPEYMLYMLSEVREFGECPARCGRARDPF